jgi:glyoxylase-like metal-dependent hydrolase (beta-lactamase superfamily II)
VEPKPESDVLERLHALMHLYKRRMHAAARDGAGGLAPMEARALRFFARHPDTTQAMFQYLTIPVTPFQQNCSLVWCDATHEAAVIDPGGDLGKLLEAVQRRPEA